jgi:predicted nucleic acid-binding protein
LIAIESRLKVVIDTNVFISAFFGGKPLEIIRLLLKGEIEVYVSPFIVWEESRIEKILDIITTRATEVYPNFRVSVISGKDDDNRILECAVEGRVDYIISGDKRHILSLREFEGIKIVSVNEFLEIISKY